MSDAYICDRCDKVTKEAAGGIVTNIDGIAGKMRSEVKSVDTGPAVTGGAVGSSLGPQQRRDSKDVTTFRPQWADLCEDCVQDLKEWWAAKE
jgi:hypothetical protein